MSSHLVKLPLELKHLIVGHIKRPSDLKALCLVSKDISEVATEHLYRDLCFPFITIEDRKRYNSLLNSRGLKFVQSIRLGLNDHHIFFECFLKLLLAKIPEDCLKILDAYLTLSRHADAIWKHQKRLRKMVVWFPPNKEDQGYQEITDPDTLQQLSSTTELHMCMDRNATSENALARQLLTMMWASLHTMRLQSAPSLPSIFSQPNFGLTHLLLEDVTISSLRLQKFPALTHLSLAYCPGHVLAFQRYAKPTLQHLCLLDCLPRAGFNMLATFLMKFNGLKSLAVRHSWYQSGTVAYLKQALGMHRETLEFLNLDVRSETGTELLEAARTCKNLNQLGLNVPLAMGFALGAYGYKDITNYLPNLVTLRFGFANWQFNSLHYYDHVKSFANDSRSPFHLKSASKLQLLCFGQAAHESHFHDYLDMYYEKKEVPVESSLFAAVRKPEDNYHLCFYRRGKNDIVEILPRLAKYHVEKSSLVDFGFHSIKTPWGREIFSGALRMR